MRASKAELERCATGNENSGSPAASHKDLQPTSNDNSQKEGREKRRDEHNRFLSDLKISAIPLCKHTPCPTIPCRPRGEAYESFGESREQRVGCGYCHPRGVTSIPTTEQAKQKVPLLDHSGFYPRRPAMAR